MDAVSTITSKGQVTIPLFIREKMGIGLSRKVVFIKERDKFYIKPARDFLSFAGTLKSKTIFDRAFP